VTTSPVRVRGVSSGSWAACLLLLLSAAGWAAPLAFADPPAKPADANPAVLEPDVQQRLLAHAPSLITVAVLKFVPGIAGLVLLILEWVRMRDVRRGLLPAPPPFPAPTAVVGLAGAAAGVFAFVALPSIVLMIVGGIDRRLLESMPVRMVGMALGGVPIAVLTVILKRRQVALGASHPVTVGPSLKDAGRTFCVATTTLLAVTVVLVLSLSGAGVEPRSQKAVNLLAFSKNPLDPWTIAVYAVLVAPWVEECVFRGLLQPAVRRRFGAQAGVWGTGLLFAGLHFESENGLANVYVLGPLFVLALFLGRLRDRTDSLVATTGLHILNNATTVLPALMLRA
jgi:membrane protease YdiL (CAAX protease family)